MHRSRLHARGAGRRLRLAGLLAMAVCSQAAAGEGTAVADGAWYGSLLRDGRPVAVSLRVSASEDQGVGRLGFGSPLNCRLDLEQGKQDGENTYRATSSNGGRYCDALHGATLTLRRADAGAVRVDIGPGRIELALSPESSFVDAPWLGRWRTSAGTAVDFAVADARPGKSGSRWSYNGARACYLDVEYAGAVGQQAYFAMTASNGGVCDRFIDGYVRLQPQGAGFQYELFDRAGQVQEHGVLERAVAH